MQRMWIDGRWTASLTKKTFPIDNPATEEIIDEVPRAGSKDADLAVESAAAAFREWRSMPGLERAALMHEFAARLRAKGKTAEARPHGLPHRGEAVLVSLSLGSPQEGRMRDAA